MTCIKSAEQISTSGILLSTQVRWPEENDQTILPGFWVLGLILNQFTAVAEPIRSELKGQLANFVGASLYHRIVVFSLHSVREATSFSSRSFANSSECFVPELMVGGTGFEPVTSCV